MPEESICRILKGGQKVKASTIGLLLLLEPVSAAILAMLLLLLSGTLRRGPEGKPLGLWIYFFPLSLLFLLSPYFFQPFTLSASFAAFCSAFCLVLPAPVAICSSPIKTAQVKVLR